MAEMDEFGNSTTENTVSVTSRDWGISAFSDRVQAALDRLKKAGRCLIGTVSFEGGCLLIHDVAPVTADLVAAARRILRLEADVHFLEEANDAKLAMWREAEDLWQQATIENKALKDLADASAVKCNWCSRYATYFSLSTGAFACDGHAENEGCREAVVEWAIQVRALEALQKSKEKKANDRQEPIEGTTSRDT